MARVEVLPHLTAEPTAWQRGGWTVALDSQAPQPAPDLLHGWDYHSRLTLQTETTVDLAKVHASCRTADDAMFDLVCIWDCRATAVRVAACRHRLSGSGSVTVESRFQIPPSTLADRVTFERQLVLAAAGTAKRDPFAPTVPGSLVLWERGDQVVSVTLEGSGGRFPVEAVDFREAGLPDAAWWLSLAYDHPDDSFLGAARLYLNTGHPAVSEMLRDPASLQAKRTLSVIQWDASRRLLREAAGDDRMLGPTFEEGSVGDVIIRMARSILQRNDLKALFSLMERDPDRFETMLQAKLRLMWDE
jgi:hypothetical protein